MTADALLEQSGSTAPRNAREQVPLLSVEDLTVHFDIPRGILGRRSDVVQAVTDVSFDIGPGETLGLVGESGSGKSTVGKAILRLLDPTSGRILFDGADISRHGPRQMRAVRRQMQVVFQDPFSSLNPRMTAGYLVGEPLVIHGVARGRDKEERVAELFRRVGLRPDQMRRYPHEFSGGQRQRVCIARALALEPRLIIADEAVSALDLSIQASIINLLADLQEDFGYAYLFIAHDISVVEHISDRVAVMYLGRIAEIGRRGDVFREPQHPYTQALLAAAPIPDPSTRGQRERVVLSGDIPSPIDPPTGCPFNTRCPYAFGRCRQEIPRLRTTKSGQRVACHLNDNAP